MIYLPWPVATLGPGTRGSLTAKVTACTMMAAGTVDVTATCWLLQRYSDLGADVIWFPPPPPHRYEGTFRAGLREGRGTFTFPDSLGNGGEGVIGGFAGASRHYEHTDGASPASSQLATASPASTPSARTTGRRGGQAPTTPSTTPTRTPSSATVATEPVAASGPIYSGRFRADAIEGSGMLSMAGVGAGVPAGDGTDTILRPISFQLGDVKKMHLRAGFTAAGL